MIRLPSTPLRGQLSFAALALLVVFGSLLGIVVLQALIVQNRVRLDAVSSELEVAREENRRLRLLEIELEAPERIQNAAMAHLGMTRPTERLYLPGIDPDQGEVRPPPFGDPFGPGPLPEELGGILAQVAELAFADGESATDAASSGDPSADDGAETAEGSTP